MMESLTGIPCPVHGKIPKEILQQAILFFRDAYFSCGGFLLFPRNLGRKALGSHKNPLAVNESMALLQIFWDPVNEKYFGYAPEQMVSPVSIMYSRDVDMERDNVLVADIHSKGVLSAYFSSVDDNDDRQFHGRFHGVVGRLDLSNPEIVMSYMDKGQRFKAKVEDIFTT